MATESFYPPLSSIIKVEDIPEQIGIIQETLNAIFDNIYYRDYQCVKSDSSDSAFYSLFIVSHKKLGFEIHGTGFSIILNPSHVNLSDVSEIPITVSYEWPILALIRNFKLSNFSFDIKAIYNKILEILPNLSVEKIIIEAVEVFIPNNALPYNDFVSRINTIFTLPIGDQIQYPSSNVPELAATEIIQSINTNTSLNSQSVTTFEVIYKVFLEDLDIEIIRENIDILFYRFLGLSSIDALNRDFHG